MSSTFTYSRRIRINARIPDKEGKYRDEIAQDVELSISITDKDTAGITEQLDQKLNEKRDLIYKEINRLGGSDYQLEEYRTDICVECGMSVRPGSGKFVNRIPVLDDYQVKVEGGRKFPFGEWICDECDKKDD
jgi:hypothetical protein